MKGQRRRLYALLMAIFMFVTTVAGNGMSLTAYADENTENNVENSVGGGDTEAPSIRTPEEPAVSPNEPDKGTLITSIDELKTAAAEGTKIAIYNASAKKAMTATASGSKLADADASVSDGKLLVPDEAVRMNVEVTTGDGAESDATDTYTFSYSSGGKTLYLTSGATGGSLTFEETANDYSLWKLSAADSEGNWFIDNVNAAYNGSAQSLEYYRGFTTYGKASSDAFKFQLYAVDEATVGYVIYNPEYGMAFSSEKATNGSGNYNAGVSMTKNANGSFDKVNDTEVWKLSALSGENITITDYAKGRKLSMGVQYASTPFDDVNDTWKILKVSDVSELVYIDNEVRTNQYRLQWRSGDSYNYFSAYSGTGEAFEMELIPVTRSQIEVTEPDEPEPTTPDEPVGDSKKYVVYNAKNKVALSSNYTGYYSKGVTMESNFTEVQDTEVWEVTTYQSGRITLTSYVTGTKLSMDGSNSSTPLDQVNDKWEKTEESNGTFYLKNAVRGRYLFWSTQYSNFTTSASITAGEEDNFKLQLIEITSDITIKETPKETHGKTIEDGNYFIYSKKAEGVMRYYLTGGAASALAATPTTDGKADFGSGDGTSAAVFTLQYVEAENAYLIKCGNEFLSLDTNNNSRQLYRAAAAVKTATNGSYWYIDENTEYGGYTVRNTTAKSRGADVYLEYYPSSGFCAYTVGSTGLTDIYVFQFLDTANIINDNGHVGTKPTPKTLPEAGKSYVIYSASGASVIGGESASNDESGSARTLSACTTTVGDDGEFSLGNGGLIFNLTKEGDDYLFENNGRYLATNTKEELLLLTKEECAEEELDTDYKWQLAATEDGLGYTIQSTNMRYNGSAPIFVEYFSGGFAGYSFKAGQPEIFTFDFIEYTDEYGFGYVVNPRVIFNSLTEANQDVDFEATFTLDDMGTPDNIRAEVKFNDNITKTYTPVMDEAKEEGEIVKTGKVVVPKADLVGRTAMDLTISVTSKMDNNVTVDYNGTRKVAINDDPLILSVSPAPNSGTGTEKRPTIKVTYANIGTNPVAKLSFNGEEGLAMQNDASAKTYSYVPETTLVDNKYTAEVTITRADGKAVTRSWSFYIGEAGYKVKFGQIHSHTAEYSDGSGDLEDAYEHAMGSATDMDYLIVTDHSNYFDTTGTATKDSIYEADASSISAGTGKYPGADASQSLNLWQEAKATAAYYDKQSSDFVAGYGYEMTWSGGPGHINVFNSAGIVSRNNTELNNKTNNAGMLAFYDLVVDADSKKNTSTGNGNISAQFNHPGTTFGFFDSFTGLTEDRDSVMNLIEVGNGDGAVGGTGYFPSYEYYDMCLSVGWHVAPTNGQDNHKGGWGSISPTRTVALTETFNEDGIYEAMNQRRIYSTEDQNLTMIYTLDEYPQGSIIEDYDKDTVELSVSLSDEDQEELGKVYVIGENGKILNEDNPEEISGNTAELVITLPNTSPYYYIKVVQKDGDIAVSAPIWVAEVGANRTKVTASIDVTNADGSAPVEKKETTIKTTLANEEESAVTLVGYSIAVEGEEVKADAEVNESIAAGDAYDITCQWTPEHYGTHKVSINFVVEVDGENRNITVNKDVYVKGEDYDTVVDISRTKTAQEGEEFTVEGIITANTSGFDKNTAFFDCTYIQDATGGINIFPVSDSFQIGQKVRVHGGIDFYNGERELTVSEEFGGYVEVISDTLAPAAPKKVSSKEAMSDANIGLLMEVSGTVSRVHEASGIIDRVYVKDTAGDEACVYINGYIWNSATKRFDNFGTKGTTVKVGDKVTAVGIGSVDVDELGEVDFLHRLRVRDRAEINVETPTTSTSVDKSALGTAITQANALKKANYTAASWTPFANALAAATTVYNNANATQAQVNSALTALNNAKAALKLAVTKLSITNGSTLKIAAGKKVKLTVSVTPSNAANKNVTWSIPKSSQKYATVNSKGQVTTKKAGAGKTVTVTATAKDGSGKKATVKIKLMKNAVTKVTLSAKTKKVKAGKKLTIKATVKTNGKSANKALTWSVDKKSTKYASINKKGVLVTKKTGKGKTVTVTATATDGSNKKATIKIRITK